jgi:tetratricopeptide (TPR) repeat protein/RIO-like serine/threonine protein kinase
MTGPGDARVRVAPVACLQEETLFGLVNGTLEADLRQRAMLHVDSCDSCRRLVATAVDALVDTSEQLRQSHEVAAHSALGLARGTRLGRYVVLDRLGEGGMGTVYAAYDPELDRKVALKILRTVAGDGAAFVERRQRLQLEAKSLARLTHPNVVAVHDVGSVGGQIFVAMELIEGRTLRAWTSDAGRGWREVLAAYRQAGTALAAAHAMGIVHRDFKPDNVLIDASGRVRVVDFGLARLVGPEAEPAAAAAARSFRDDGAATQELTRTGSLIGTPAYMAPEQLRGGVADAAADQFSFCVSLYEALWQQRPFAGDSFVELARAVTAGELRPPPRNARAPLWLHRVLAKGLRPAPEERHPSLAALLTELEHDPGRARRRVLGAVAVVAVVAAAGAGVVHERAVRSRVCRGGAQKLAGVWNEARRSAMHAAFAATRTPFSAAAFTTTTTALDRYFGQWAAAHQEACEATRVRGEQSEEMLELRIECLDQQRQEANALVELFTRADAPLVQRAPQAVQSLPGYDACRNNAALRQVVRPPPGSAAQARVAALRTRLAEATAQLDAGRYAEGRKLADAIVVDAGAVAYAPLEAEALVVRANAEEHTGDARAALETLLAAVVASEAGHDDHTRARALIELVFEAGNRLSRAAESHAYQALARAAIARLGGDAQLELRLDENVAVGLMGEGRYDDSIAALQALLTRKEQIFGPLDLNLGGTHIRLGEAHRHRGHLDEAIAHHKQAVAILTATYGPAHPQTAFAWNALGGALTDKHEGREAVAAFEKALAIREAALGPDHPNVAQTLGDLGMAYVEISQYDRALALLERGYAIAVRSVGPDREMTWVIELNLAEVLLQLHRRDEALSHAEHVLATAEKLYDPDSPGVATVLAEWGRIHVARHENSVAIKGLERGIAIMQRHPAEPDTLALAQLALAQALWDSGGDRVRAHALAEAARQHASRPTEAEAWLATHRP